MVCRDRNITASDSRRRVRDSVAATIGNDNEYDVKDFDFDMDVAVDDNYDRSHSDKQKIGPRPTNLRNGDCDGDHMR